MSGRHWPSRRGPSTLEPLTVDGGSLAPHNNLAFRRASSLRPILCGEVVERLFLADLLHRPGLQLDLGECHRNYAPDFDPKTTAWVIDLIAHLDVLGLDFLALVLRHLVNRIFSICIHI